MEKAMRHELEQNSHKGNFHDITPEEAIHETFYHSVKLALAMQDGGHPEAVLEYAADVANSAMFCALTQGALEYQHLRTGHAEDYDAPWRFKLPRWKARMRGLVKEITGTRPRPRTPTVRAGWEALGRRLRRWS
jgi:hypothetical protein